MENKFRAFTVIQIIQELLEAVSKEQLYSLKLKGSKVLDPLRKINNDEPTVIQKLRKDAASDLRLERAEKQAEDLFDSVKKEIIGLGYDVERYPGREIVNKYGEKIQDYHVVASIEIPLTSAALSELLSPDYIKTFILSDSKALEFIDKLRKISTWYMKTPSSTSSDPTVLYSDKLITFSYDEKNFLLTVVLSLKHDFERHLDAIKKALEQFKSVISGLADYGRSANWGTRGQHPVKSWYANAKSVFSSLGYSSELLKDDNKTFILDDKLVVGTFRVLATTRYDLSLERSDFEGLPPEAASTLVSPYQIVQFFKKSNEAASLLQSFARFSKQFLGETGENTGVIEQGILYKNDALEVTFAPKAQHVRFFLQISFKSELAKRFSDPKALVKPLKDINGLWVKLFVYFRDWRRDQINNETTGMDYEKAFKTGLPSQTWRDHIAKEHELAGKKPSEIHDIVRSLATGS
jgi:hypothetical protein